MTELEVGALLGGKYRIEGVLGRGGMGVVVAARHVGLDQRVAIKFLLSQALESPDVVERFAREARAAAKISGEHVARVIDVGIAEDGSPFMVMEHLQGHDLAMELQLRGTASIEDAVRYVLQTCEAVAQAHALRIVHRDLKPSNLFLAETPGRRPIIKVLDFGISKVVEPSASGVLTTPARLMGTPYYMSPEQLLSARSVDARSDIWSLGVILYELLVGAPPFAAETAPEVIAKIIQGAPVPPSVARPDLPPSLEATVLRCLSSQRGDRFADVAELAAALAPHAALADRDSAEVVTRVLRGHPAARPASEPRLSARSPLAQSVAETPPAHQVPHRAPHLATAPNLTISSSVVPRGGRGRWGWMAAGVGALVGLGLCAVAYRSAPAQTSTASSAAPATPTAVALPSASATVSAGPAPSPQSGASPSAPVAVAASLGTSRAVRSATPPHVPVPSASQPPPVPSASAPRNPLDLQLKYQ